MAEITAAMVKSLREETSQGMMECKKALTEANGDLEQAKMILRKKGMATLEKKAARETSEGLVAIRVTEGGGSATMVMVRCETDFCARNDVFKTAVAHVLDLATAADDGSIEATQEITDAVQAAFEKIGENMSYGRGAKISAPHVGSYLHHNNKTGVILGVDGEIDTETLTGLCMHIAFTKPMGLTKDDIPAELVEKEKEVALAQAMDSGKPKDIAEKMVTGKINKFLAANALLEQPYVRDESRKVKDVLSGATITAYAIFDVAE